MSDKAVLLYIAAFIFVTELKSAFPDKNREIRQKALEIINSEARYVAFAEAMGRSISKENFKEELIEVLNSGEDTPFPAMNQKIEDSEDLVREIILNE